MSYYNDLITTIKSRSSTKIIVSAIIPRPCDLTVDPSEKRVKNMNKELKKMCKRRHLQFLQHLECFCTLWLRLDTHITPDQNSGPDQIILVLNFSTEPIRSWCCLHFHAKFWSAAAAGISGPISVS